VTRQWADVDPVQVSAYCADKADRLRDHEQLTRETFGPTWATYLVLGDSELVYRVDLWLQEDRWAGWCEHPLLFRERHDIPIRVGQSCSHIHAAAAEEARVRNTYIPVPPQPDPFLGRPAGATAGFYD